METKKLINVRNVLRVALYIRVSSQEQVEGYSIGEQTDRLKKYCEAMGWEVYKIYVDPGYSGGNTDRPGLQELKKDVEADKVDKVVVYKLDRLSRSQLDTLYLIEKVFLANNTDFVSMSENFDTSTPFGRAMIGILAVFAQLEREQIKERMGMGKQARAKEGKWNGGSSEPIGYDYNITTGELEVNEYEKMQILEAIDLFLKGTPLRTICNIFDEKGYTYRGKSGRTSKWDPKRLKYVFTNKIYLGYMRYHGEWYKGTHTPIIDEDTFDKMQKLLEERAERYAKHKKLCSKQSSYLGGFLYCKHCGGRYAKTTWNTRKPGVRKGFYTCYSRSKKVPKMVKDPNCINKNWRIEELDEIVINEIKKLAFTPDYYNVLCKESQDKNDTPNKVELLKHEIQKIEDQISRFMDLYGIGKFTIDQVSGKVDPLNEQKKGLEKELESLNASAQNTLTKEEVANIVNSFEDILNRGDLDEIRLVIENLIYYIELDNDDVYIHWKFV